MRQRGISASSIAGSGPGGRIVEADVLTAVAPTGVATAPASASTSSMRRAVAANTSASFATTPHFYLRAEIDATALIDLRSQLAEAVQQETGVRLTLTDFLLAALGQALRDHPAANRVWQGDSMTPLTGANVGLVVGLDDGLLIPTLRDTDRLRLADLARQRAALVESARAGRTPSAARCATSLSNLGAGRVDEFAAVIPHGQSSVLAVGRVAPRPFVVDGSLAVRQTLRLCLSVDHRVLDGQPAAQFLGRIAELLEKPALLLYQRG